MGQFPGSRLKIDRADHHIARLKTWIESLEQSDVAVVEIDLKFGNEVIKHDIARDDSARMEAINQMALIAGDAVHNLKCALDYAWIETITKLAPHALERFGKFPIYPTYNALESALRGHGIEGAPMDLFKVILTEIKPYSGGDFAIWPIHRLDIRDKHRLLIPVIFYTSITGIETEDEAGELFRNGFTAGTYQQPPWYIPMPLGVHVKNKGKVSLDISFKYGNAGDETIYADTLKVYSRTLLSVVERLETLV